MSMKGIKSYFSFSRKELNGIFLLLMLIQIALMFPFVYRYYYKAPEYDLSGFESDVMELHAQIERSKNIKLVQNTFVPRYFKFDPNELDENSWKKLGVSEGQIKIILKYKARGGKFFRREDLKRIYSISDEQYLKLEPYIQIKPLTISNKSLPAHVKMPHSKKMMLAILVEINSADSAGLTEIRGIGPAFASRIIRYRNRLGGFISKEQLKEVYGIDSIKYQQISSQINLDPSLINRININSVTFDTFKHFPYLSYKQMNAILQYRRQHGQFKTIEDLSKVAIINEEIIRKIEPYISIDP